jgi:hypothetical protein
MISDESKEMVPFLLRFARPVPSNPRHAFRYDAARQLSQVLVDGVWVDSPDAGDLLSGTVVTEVRTETTDE